MIKRDKIESRQDSRDGRDDAFYSVLENGIRRVARETTKKKKKEKASTRMNQLILFLSFFFFFFLYPFSQFSFFHRKSVESIEMGKENHLLRACHDFSQYLSSLFRSFSLEGNDTILSIRRDLLTDDQLLVYCFLLCVFFFRKKKKRERRNATQGNKVEATSGKEELFHLFLNFVLLLMEHRSDSFRILERVVSSDSSRYSSLASFYL